MFYTIIHFSLSFIMMLEIVQDFGRKIQYYGSNEKLYFFRKNIYLCSFDILIVSA